MFWHTADITCVLFEGSFPWGILTFSAPGSYAASPKDLLQAKGLNPLQFEEQLVRLFRAFALPVGLRLTYVPRDCRSGARGRPSAPAPRGPGEGCCRRGRCCFRRLIGNCRAPPTKERHGQVMWVSREAAFRSIADWKDATMLSEAATCNAVIGLDVGKFSHWACHVSRRGEVLGSGPVANTEHDLDDLFGRAGAGTLVVVAQVRNIGSLAISRARLAGLPVAYLPGIAAHGAAKLFAGDAKTDERDAAVIAKTALGIPDSLLPVPERGERLEAARSMAAQRSHMVACSTRDKNRLRSILLESYPAFEALADPHWLRTMESLGGPWGIVDAGEAALGAVARGASRARIDAAVAAALGVPGHGGEPAGEGARQENQGIRGGGGRARGRDSGAAGRGRRLLMPPVRPGDRPRNRVRAGDRHRHRRLSRPRPPRILLRDRAREPAVGQVDIVVGLVPAGEQAAEEPAHLLLQLAQPQQGPVRRLLPQMQGPRHVHGEALKAVARKRMKVICAIMRDEVPYSA